jgi:hypothetical protein
LIQTENGHGDHGLVAGGEDFLMIWRGVFRISPWFYILPESNAFGIQEASFVAVFMRFSNGKLAGIQKAGRGGGKAERKC